jgi:UDP-N-acetylglucosamine 2-epimerase (non-hydrolysing)
MPGKKVLLVFGTRPEAIKMAPVYMELRSRPDIFETVCCVTGQHHQMLHEALQTFGIVPDVDLDLMRDDQNLTDLSASILSAVRPVFAKLQPDVVLVHGDTTTTMATALAAYYAGIEVGHVEAGLRSGNLHAPFPEELNRRVTSLVSAHHFAPTSTSRDNLLREGCDAASIRITGNTVVDALRIVSERLDTDGAFGSAVAQELAAALDFDWRSERFVLVTCHRREAFGKGIAAICDAIAELSHAFPTVRFVLPVHPNPQVRGAIATRLAGLSRIHLTRPLRYAAFVALLRACEFVVTDSGGIQEEAPSFAKPVLVTREVTERPEAIAAGCARLVGMNAAAIVAAAGRLLRDPAERAAMVTAINPYGDGRAAARIATALAEG